MIPQNIPPRECGVCRPTIDLCVVQKELAETQTVQKNQDRLLKIKGAKHVGLGWVEVQGEWSGKKKLSG